jgi:hypothetical protein
MTTKPGLQKIKNFYIEKRNINAVIKTWEK